MYLDKSVIGPSPWALLVYNRRPDYGKLAKLPIKPAWQHAPATCCICSDRTFWTPTQKQSRRIEHLVTHPTGPILSQWQGRALNLGTSQSSEGCYYYRASCQPAYREVWRFEPYVHRTHRRILVRYCSRHFPKFDCKTAGFFGFALRSSDASLVSLQTEILDHIFQGLARTTGVGLERTSSDRFKTYCRSRRFVHRFPP